jgi:hypothetical protein
MNVESQACVFSRVSGQNPHTPRQARIRATHALHASDHVSPLCGRSQEAVKGHRKLTYQRATASTEADTFLTHRMAFSISTNEAFFSASNFAKNFK